MCPFGVEEHSDFDNKVQVVNEKAQSERNSYSKNRGGKKQNDN